MIWIKVARYTAPGNITYYKSLGINLSLYNMPENVHTLPHSNSTGRYKTKRNPQGHKALPTRIYMATIFCNSKIQ